MEETVMICNNEVQVKEWDGKRVVTFDDIDRVHGRPEGTAKTRFYRHKERLNEGEDYFIVKPADIEKYTTYTLDFKIPNRGLVLITESGYLMIVKTFNDDQSWRVQRQLVNTYFKAKELVTGSHEIVVSEEVLNVMKDLIDAIKGCEIPFQQVKNQSNALQQITDYLTINSRQQQIILQAGKDRINYLLGGAHSARYKEQSRMYFKNMWQQFGKRFQCGTYKDLNPAYMNDAYEWISKWKYE